MEVDPEPPTWASIVKKEKRFSLDIQFNFVDNLTIPSPPAINLIEIQCGHSNPENGDKSEKYPESSPILPTRKRLRLVGGSEEEPLLLISQSQSSSTTTSTSSNSRSGSPSSSEDPEENSPMNPPKLPIESCPGVQDLSIRKTHFQKLNFRSWSHIQEGAEPQDLSIKHRPKTSTDEDDRRMECEGVQDLSIHSKPKGPLIIDLEEAEGNLIIVEEESNAIGHRDNKGSLLSSAGPGLFRSVSFPTTKDNNQETEVKRRGRRRKDEETAGKPFICFLCNFTSPREAVLNNHMTRMHTVKGNRGNVRCTVCAYSCPSVDELRSHQELIHGGDDPEVNPFETKIAFHACTHCTKKFRSQTQLQAHLRLIAQKQLWKDLKARRIT